MGSKSKVTKKKGPKGKRARAKAKLEQVWGEAVDEDVDLVGLSMLSGAHMALAPKVVNQLRARNSEIPVVVGGIIPKRDIVKLKTLGIRDVLTAGSTPDEVVAVIRRAIEPS